MDKFSKIDVNCIDNQLISDDIQRLNPKVKVIYDEHYEAICCSCLVKDLILPKGFYHNKKNGITNKHKTKNGLYTCLHVKYQY